MTEEQAERSIRKEANRLRKRGGAADVTPSEWRAPGVSRAMRSVVGIACAEKFNGKWDDAPVVLDEALGFLMRALRRLAKQGAGDGGRDTGAGFGRFLTTPEPSEDRGNPDRPALSERDAGGEALADLLSWHLRRDGFAQDIHETICGGEYLRTREEAWQFLTSPLPRVFSTEDYQRLGLRPVAPGGKVITSVYSREGHIRYLTEVDLPNGAKHQQIVLRDPARGAYVAHTDELPQPCTVRDADNLHVNERAQAPPYFQDEVRRVEGMRDSVMYELIETAEILCRSYPVAIWDMLEALLTGKLPPTPAVEIFDGRVEIEPEFYEKPAGYREGPAFTAQGPATVTVQPWVTPDVLAACWRNYRATRGITGHSPKPEQAAVVRFVLEPERTTPGGKPQWEHLACLWREERGGKMARGQLQTLFERARRVILPGYRE